MSVLGIDVGTTGCKVACFSTAGDVLGTAYREYDIIHRRPGWAELDAGHVWAQIKDAIREAVANVAGLPLNASPSEGGGKNAGRSGVDPVRALAVSSLGEAVVAVTGDRLILAPSILNFDVRGETYLEGLAQGLDGETLYRINGNVLGNHYGLTKLLWIRDHEPAVYDRTHKFLLWSSFVAHMLGAEPIVDRSLANRTLLFDLEAGKWSETLLAWAGLDRDKLPEVVPTGTVVGTLAPHVARELGLPGDVAIVAGAHDQCANAVGCGVIEPGHAVYGMGTFICITPVYTRRPDADLMRSQGLNTEHHAVPGALVSFIYNQGGSLVKWYRDTFAAAEHARARTEGRDAYDALFAELPAGPSGLTVLPHFTTTGPPDFVADSAGVIAGLRLETPRGAILKAIVEGATFYLRSCIEGLPELGIAVDDFRAVGGGSKSDAWVQLTADILGRPLTRPLVTEAGALGAAIIAGVGSGQFGSYLEAIGAMVGLERTFEPDMVRHRAYHGWFDAYRRLWPLMADYLRALPVL